MPGPDAKETGPRAWLVPAVLLAALVPRAVLAWLHPGTYDVDRYVSLALSILERGEYSLQPGIPSMVAAPLFPLWICALYAAFGRHPYLLLLGNAGLSAATGGLLFLLGRRLFSRRVGLAALTLWAVYPYSIYYCTWTYRESFLVFLSTALLLALVELFASRSRAAAAASGLAGALLGLTNPSCLIYVGLVPLGLLRRARPAETARLLAVYYLCLGAAYSPWVIRNQLAFGRPILTNVHGGMNLYHGLRLGAEEFGTPAETEFHRRDPVERQALALIDAGKEAEADDLYKRAARSLARREPGLFLRRCGERFVKFWRPVPYRRAYDWDYGKVFWASLLSDGLLIPLGLAGLWVWRRRWRELLPLLALLLLWPLAYYLVYAVVRFRMPAMPVLILFAASWLERWPVPGAQPKR